MKNTSRSSFTLILLLGGLATVCPFAIDLYLPAFSRIAADFGTTIARVGLSLSSYFIGLSAGQLFYGPILDRFGRKRPVFAGLVLFLFASIGCAFSGSIEALVAFRALQALGGCAGQVGSMAMVRDFFPPRESAKIFSLLMLVISVSPLFAPSIGGAVTAAWGWRAVFGVLAGLVLAILLAATFFLPPPAAPDPTVQLRPGSIARGYVAILRERRFVTYCFSGALSFSGLFVYLAASPLLFIKLHGVGERQYAGIFALIAMGFIGLSQLNVVLIRRFESARILRVGMMIHVALSVAFFLRTCVGDPGLYELVAFFFLYLGCAGVIGPNGSALTLAPFTRNIGSASAMMGFIQMGLGGMTSAVVGLLNASAPLPIAAILAALPVVALGILMMGSRGFGPLPEDGGRDADRPAPVFTGH